MLVRKARTRFTYSSLMTRNSYLVDRIFHFDVQRCLSKTGNVPSLPPFTSVKCRNLNRRCQGLSQRFVSQRFASQ